MQIIIGCFMLWIGRNAEALLASAEKGVTRITIVFVLMITLAATQGEYVIPPAPQWSTHAYALVIDSDIAVDGEDDLTT